LTTPLTPPASVRSQAIEIARGWSSPKAPQSWALTAAIFTSLAEDEQLLALAAVVPEERLPALLFCAAACHLIDGHQPPELVDYFPTAGAPQPEVDRGFGPALRAFCLDHRAELFELFGRRRYQMNEVARSTQVALALATLALPSGSVGVAIIDLGTGAGLGLHLDRYGHRLTSGSWLGDQSSSLVLDCEVEGATPPPLSGSLPTIGLRIGIDLDPIDLSDPEDRRWARSCVPPESDSLARFDQACLITQSHPCTIVRGDAVELLQTVLDEVPDRLLPVVVDTYTAVFLSDQERARLRRILEQRGAGGELAWISLDPLVPLGTSGRDSVQGLDVPEHLVVDYQVHGVFALLGVMTFDHGETGGSLLARAHPSGTSVRWLAGGGSG
jgi:hypothetical protein